jgi:lipid A disaccharide synthetase
MKTQKSTVIQETSTGPNDDSPGVVAYRVGRLEVAVREGFLTQAEQLRNIVDGFVTEKELTEAKAAGDEIHQRLTEQTNNHDNRLRTIEDDLNQTKGAVNIMKLALTTLSAVAAVVGALWWVKG